MHTYTRAHTGTHLLWMDPTSKKLLIFLNMIFHYRSRKCTGHIYSRYVFKFCIFPKSNHLTLNELKEDGRDKGVIYSANLYSLSAMS